MTLFCFLSHSSLILLSIISGCDYYYYLLPLLCLLIHCLFIPLRSSQLHRNSSLSPCISDPSGTLSPSLPFPFNRYFLPSFPYHIRSIPHPSKHLFCALSLVSRQFYRLIQNSQNNKSKFVPINRQI